MEEKTDSKDLWKKMDRKLPLRKFYETISGEQYQGATYHALIITPNTSENSAADYRPFSVSTSYPLPFSLNERDCIPDPVKDYYAEKKTWSNVMPPFKQAHRAVPAHRRIRGLKNDINIAKIPQYIASFAEILSCDPDPYYKSKHNWYFTGKGNLCTAFIDGQTFLIKSAVNVISVHKFHEGFREEEMCRQYANNLIHETRSVSLDTTVICVRMKHDIQIFKLVTANNFSIDEIGLIESKIPIAGFDIDAETIHYTCVDDSIHSYDIHTKAHMIIKAASGEDVKCNNWSSVRMLDFNNFLYVTPQSVEIWDKRERKFEKDSFEKTAMSCEKIAMLELGSSQNYAYVVGTHSVQLCDVRFNQDYDCTYVKKWSHTLEHTPSYLQVTSLFNSELIAVSCNAVDRIIFLMNSLEECGDTFLPWRPRTLLDTFDEAQLRGFCLDPTTRLKNRLRLSRTGSIFLPIDGKPHMIMLNSLGDMFYQSVDYGNPSDFDDAACEALQSWSDRHPTSDTSFRMSNTIDMTKLYKKIKNNTRHNTRIFRNPTDVLARNERWISRLKYLSECTDFCAHDLFAAWELTDEDIEYDPRAPSMPDTKFNVNEWISQSK